MDGPFFHVLNLSRGLMISLQNAGRRSILFCHSHYQFLKVSDIDSQPMDHRKNSSCTRQDSGERNQEVGFKNDLRGRRKEVEQCFPLSLKGRSQSLLQGSQPFPERKKAPHQERLPSLKEVRQHEGRVQEHLRLIPI